ncbi:MAG TPA: chemotaxis protein CheW [Nitrospiraceae bacterium]|nr:chemotaxis protein CheW [Nitrospiraceae bacterium]
MSLRGRQNSTNMLVATASFLVVRLGHTYLALPATGVRGVLTQEEAGHERTVTTAGSLYRPVDLAQQLSIVANLSGIEMRTVLYSAGGFLGAICVEQVVGLIDVERNKYLPLPPQFRGDERNWFGGMMLYQDQLVLILNPSWALGALSSAEPASLERTEQLVKIAPAAVGESC